VPEFRCRQAAISHYLACRRIGPVFRQAAQLARPERPEKPLREKIGFMSGFKLNRFASSEAAKNYISAFPKS
jgi:hypothetical protein